MKTYLHDKTKTPNANEVCLIRKALLLNKLSIIQEMVDEGCNALVASAINSNLDELANDISKFN